MKSRWYVADRTLETICEDGDGLFHNQVLGNNYCMLSPTEDRVNCFYRSEGVNQDGIFTCNNKKYQKKVIEDYESVAIEFEGFGHA